MSIRDDYTYAELLIERHEAGLCDWDCELCMQAADRGCSDDFETTVAVLDVVEAAKEGGDDHNG